MNISNKMKIQLPNVNTDLNRLTKFDVFKLINILNSNFSYRNDTRTKDTLQHNDIGDIISTKIYDCRVAGPKVGCKNRKVKFVSVKFYLREEYNCLEIPLNKYRQILH